MCLRLCLLVAAPIMETTAVQQQHRSFSKRTRSSSHHLVTHVPGSTDNASVEERNEDNATHSSRRRGTRPQWSLQPPRQEEVALRSWLRRSPLRQASASADSGHWLSSVLQLSADSAPPGHLLCLSAPRGSRFIGKMGTPTVDNGPEESISCPPIGA
ncbi:hypothetical protein TSMEX_011545 [Taenia solium]|eukprot:TsM_000226100 transcript=TsM_000226100 gene=TsM_000226100